MNDPIILKKVLTNERLDKLNNLYSKVPKGTCSACARCCSESVNISFLEFVNIVENGLSRLDEKTFNALSERLMRYYLLEWVKPQQCPFLDAHKNCLIYEVRPLPCRIFGTSSREDYMKNYQRIASQNRQVAKAIKLETGYLPSAKVVNKEISFCESFIPEKRLSAEEIDALYGQLINLDGQLYFEGLIDDSKMNGNLVGWMIEWLVEGLSDEATDQHSKLIDQKWLYALKKECLSLYSAHKFNRR